MTDAVRREDLRPHLRDERPPDDALVVVRGGPTTLAKLVEHVRRTHDAFVLDGEDLWGVSVFCAVDDIGPGSLDSLLRRFASYRVVHLPTVGELSAGAFRLLPSFARPHYTVQLPSDDQSDLAHLLLALGPARPNPYHGRPRRPRS